MYLNQSFGLGDLAHWLFRPVACGVDLLWGTDLRHCDRCAERRRRWNAKFAMAAWRWVVLLTGATILYLVLR